MIEQHLINLANTSKQSKNQRAIEIKIKILKQTRDEELTEAFTPMTKKLAEVNETTIGREEVLF